MSNTLENHSQNSSDEFKLTGWEIQPLVAEEMVVDYRSDALHHELVKILKKMISQTIAPMKVASEAQNIENSSFDKALVVVPTTDIQAISHMEVTSDALNIDNSAFDKALVLVPTTDMAAPKKSARIRTSTVVGKFYVNFQLPADCIANKIDMDQLSDVEGNINLGCQFSFKERLEGWHVECRQRPNKIIDMFYRYHKSKGIFRSVPEVVNFLLYGRYPNCRRKEKGPLADNVTAQASRGNRKRKSPSDNRHEKIEEEYVQEFFHAAIPKQTNKNMGGSKNEGVISEEADSCERTENKTCKKISMTSGLLNISNDMKSMNKKEKQRNSIKKSREDQECSDAHSSSSVPESSVAHRFNSVPFNPMEVQETSEAMDNHATHQMGGKEHDQRAVAEVQELQVEIPEDQAIADVLVNSSYEQACSFPEWQNVMMDWTADEVMFDAYIDRVDEVNGIQVCTPISEFLLNTKHI